jgi:hypothetical protein
MFLPSNFFNMATRSSTDFAGEVVVQPIHVAADIGDAIVEAEGFGHVEAAFLVDGKANRIGQQRLGGEEFDLEAFGHAEAFDGSLAFIGGGSDLRRRIRAAGNEFGRWGANGQHENRGNGPNQGRNSFGFEHKGGE